jgi:hypothetical protein
MNKNTKSFQQFLLLLCSFVLAFSLSASAQDLKPAKDKATKKYGYQGKGNKAWVIPPSFDDAKKFVDGTAEVELDGHWGLIDLNGNMIFPAIYDNIGKFDKHGYCELMRKVNGTKLRGIADRNGRIIIPVEARGVDVDRSGEFMYAKYDTEVPEFGVEALWGIYDNQGRELLKPQLSYTPTFRDGIGIGKSELTGLYGIIGGDGSILKPFQYLNITRSSGAFNALGTDLKHYVWSPDLRDGQELRQPGAIIPYDPQGDPIRVAAWQKGPIGRRLYANMVRVVEFHTGFMGSTKAACNMLNIDWGRGRFIRLEPCLISGSIPDAMRYGGGNRYYTLKAILYEADGTFVKEVCSRGWIEGDFSEGAIYNADGKQRWAIMANPNALGLPAYTIDIHDYRPFGHADVFEGLGFSVAELSKIRSSLYNYTSRCKDIYETENVGVCSYIPRMPSSVHAQAEFAASKSHIFHYNFRMGEVVNCAVRHKDGKDVLELMPDLTCIYKDKIEDPSYTMSEREEVIYWGPNNARTVRLCLEAVSHNPEKYTADDSHGTGYSYMLVLNMFEEDGTWLRTLAAAPWADYFQDGILVFEPLGIAMISPFRGRKPGPAAGPGQPQGKPGQPQGQAKPQSNPQNQGPTVQSRSGQPTRGTTTTASGGSRESAGVPANTGNPAPDAAPGPGELQPLAHTISALESVIRL